MIKYLRAVVMTLDQVDIGKSVCLEKFELAPALYLKLLVYGVLPGDKVEILNKVPFGGPLFLRVRGISFSLRKKEASQIMVS